MVEIAVALLALRLILVLNTLVVSPLWAKLQQLRTIHEGISKMRDDFDTILAVLLDAENMESANEVTKVWLRQVRNVAHETQDVIDKLSCRLGMLGRLSYASVLWHTSKWNQIASEIGHIKVIVHNIYERKNQLGLQLPNRTLDSTSNLPDFRLILPIFERRKGFGYENEKRTLATLLLEDDANLQVIAVWGLGGVGKTTLVSNICSEVGEKFDCQVWISFGNHLRGLEVGDILRDMMKHFHIETNDINFYSEFGIRESIKSLKDFLQHKKYIVIVDNVWDDQKWEALKSAFPENALHSRVIVTTRSKNVATSCATGYNTLELCGLGEKDAFNLLFDRALRGQDSSCCSHDLIDIGWNIVRKCGGLPFIIVAVGGQLAIVERTLFQWDKILKSDFIGSEVNKVLSLSYDKLPSPLKHYFLYFGMYPPSYEIKCVDLIRQWIDEGFINPTEGMSLEEEAYKILAQLAETNLILVVKLDCLGRAEVCRVHEMMHYVILEKSNEENFLATLSVTSDCRRLTIYPTRCNPMASIDWSIFRSLFVFGPNALPPLAKLASMLKVLCLYDVQLDSFPTAIFDLKWLRHLCLRKTNVRIVPKAIKKLKYLQTLDLKYTAVTLLPKEILKLKVLRYLLVCDDNRIRGTRLPKKLGKLTALEKLLLVNVEDASQQVREFGNLTQLKRLCVTSFRKRDGPTLCNSISKMRCLQSLVISSTEEVEIYTIPSPPTELRSVKINGYMSQIPEWLLECSRLVKLHLQHSKLTADPFPALQSLQSLADLRLLNEACTGHELNCGPKGFPGLKTLHVENLCIKSIQIDKEGMQGLEIWKIRDCQSLDIPPLVIEHLPCLKEIHLPPALCKIFRSAVQNHYVVPSSKHILVIRES